MNNIKAYIWMIKEFGICRTYIYEKHRKEGLIIDYSKIFSSKELNELEQKGIAPWLKD